MLATSALLTALFDKKITMILDMHIIKKIVN